MLGKDVRFARVDRVTSDLRLLAMPMRSVWLALPPLLAFQVASFAQEAPKTTLDKPDRVRHFDDIPAAVRDVIINDERDLEDLAPKLKISGNEQLRLKDIDAGDGRTTTYTFEEWINDILTENTVEFLVDNETRLVIEVNGEMEGGAGLPLTAHISEEDALSLVISHVKRGNKRVWPVPVDFNGKHGVYKFYRNQEIWWRVGLKLTRKPHPNEAFEWYLVSPEGKVEPWIEGFDLSISPAEACDGRSNPEKPFCSLDPDAPSAPIFPKVIN